MVVLYNLGNSKLAPSPSPSKEKIEKKDSTSPGSALKVKKFEGAKSLEERINKIKTESHGSNKNNNGGVKNIEPKSNIAKNNINSKVKNDKIEVRILIP